LVVDDTVLSISKIESTVAIFSPGSRMVWSSVQRFPDEIKGRFSESESAVWIFDVAAVEKLRSVTLESNSEFS
jgi:hypothetical protein